MYQKHQKQPKKSSALGRICASAALLGSVFIAPWWLTLLAAILFTAVLPQYPEVILFGLLFDILYATEHALSFAGTLTVFVIYVCIYFIRKHMRV